MIPMNNTYLTFVVKFIAKFCSNPIQYITFLQAFSGSKIMTWLESLITSKKALFLSTFTFPARVSYIINPKNVIMPYPDILSKKDLTFIHLSSLVLSISVCKGNTSIYLFKNLNCTCLVHISALNSATFLHLKPNPHCHVF